MKSLLASSGPRAAAVLAILQGVGALAPGLVAHAFVAPSGRLAACLLGVPALGLDAGSVALGLPGLDVRLTAACSGFGFFCILSAYLIYRLEGLRIRWWPALVAGCWLGALGANALRIATSIRVRQLTTPLLPEHYQNIVHQATGTLVFLGALVAVAILLQRLSRHDPRTRLASTTAAA